MACQFKLCFHSVIHIFFYLFFLFTFVLKLLLGTHPKASHQVHQSWKKDWKKANWKKASKGVSGTKLLTLPISPSTIHPSTTLPLLQKPDQQIVPFKNEPEKEKKTHNLHFKSRSHFCPPPQPPVLNRK